jgi:hypothetical protein
MGLENGDDDLYCDGDEKDVGGNKSDDDELTALSSEIEGGNAGYFRGYCFNPTNWL